MSTVARLSPSPTRVGPQRVIIVLVACLAVYSIDLACLATVPADAHTFTANVAVPFDLMVCAPAVFYLLLIRPRKLTPLLVLPVIYVGGIVSAQFAVPGPFTLHPLLLVVAELVDVAVVIHEVPRLGHLFLDGFRKTRTSSGWALDWFAAGMAAMTGSAGVSRMAALELSIWYYAVASWRSQPDVPQGCHAFSCHRETGYLALSGVVMALFPIEAFVVHLLVMQWSWIAATALTVLALYTLVWMVGNTRAVVLNPILVSSTTLIVRWGAYFQERIPLDSIDRLQSEEPSIPKCERMDMGVMGARPCWIMLSEPVTMHTITGRPRSIRAINVSPDNRGDFRKAILKQH